MAKATKKKKKQGKITPLMGQYFRVKAKHPDAILLFRVGDFYETFGEDAVQASQILGIVLTSRNNGGSDIELAGFPHHSLDLYLPKLVKAGFRVAICEQLEKPSPQKKIVKRGVTEVVTPGLATDDQLLDHKRNNFLASIYFGRKGQVGLSLLDVSTGEFLVAEGSTAYVDKIVQSFEPAELIFPKDRKKELDQAFGDRFYLFKLDEWIYTLDYAREKLLDHFGVSSLKGFGVEELELAQVASGAILHYLENTENRNLSHIASISRLHSDRHVWLDRFTIRNLELLHSNQPNGVSLLDVLDQTVTPMGARMLKKWVVLPLLSPKAIGERHSAVAYFLDQPDTSREVEQLLRQVGDLERLISKVPLGKINPREVRQLGKSIGVIAPLKNLLAQTGNELLVRLADALHPCPKLRERIRQSLVEEPPVNLTKGGVIADGWDEQLDQWRHLITNSKGLLEDIQQREIARTGINSLKIGFNSVFGYYLEVTHKYRDQAPPEWVRKQTLTNSERYITEELKELESKILGAEERILEREAELFRELLHYMQEYIRPVQHNAAGMAQVDCLLSFAVVASKNGYTRPDMQDGYAIDIEEGRHPVIEQHLPLGETYVPNDVYLDRDSQQILMITGPNMSGKSALLRQTALICLMAQMGSFVPARRASLGILDKVFTRVGASDNISSGESTFMVEMNETASIMNNISDRSLILLDEIGRGTSTYDGISIAWSIAEFLHQNEQARPKTLFATHYHELNELTERFPRIKNFNVATREAGHQVIFLRKLVPGGSQHSFGIHVARMAGMPRAIVERASHILTQLEQKQIESQGEHGLQVDTPRMESISPQPLQLSIFETTDPTAGKLKGELLELDLNRMTPIECMMKLHELKKWLEE